MKMLHMVTFLLMAVCALNWGLMGLANINLVNMLVGSMPMVERAVYVLVGLSAVVELAMHPKCCAVCDMGKKM